MATAAAVVEVVREAGREEGRAEALRVAIKVVCEAYGVPFGEGRDAQVPGMSAAELDALWHHLTTCRRWPDNG